LARRAAFFACLACCALAPVFSTQRVTLIEEIKKTFDFGERRF